jgi:Co/Zn/Cd efflux system component
MHQRAEAIVDHRHAHEHADEEHDHGHGPHHGHSHGLVDPSITRSRDGVRTVSISLAVLGAAALVQLAIFVLSSSVALLADLIHNFGDALTAVPLGIAFLLRSARGEKLAGLATTPASTGSCLSVSLPVLPLSGSAWRSQTR